MGQTVQDHLPSPTLKRTADDVKEAREAKRQGDNSLGSTQGRVQIRWGGCIMGTTSCFTISWNPCAMMMVWTAWLPREKRYLTYLLGLCDTGEPFLHITSGLFMSDYWWQVCFARPCPYLRVVVLFYAFRLCRKNAGTIIAEVPTPIRRGCWLSHGSQSSCVSTWITWNT